jgi:hypothetical protein
MRIAAPPVISAACHCTGCQKLTGGAYSLTLMIPVSGFEVEGETQLGALHRAESQHHYCTRCLGWLYTTAPGLAAQGVLNFRSTMLDDASWVVPFVESNVTQKLHGVVTGAKHSFDGFPPPSEYGRLMQEYAQEGAKPR